MCGILTTMSKGLPAHLEKYKWAPGKTATARPGRPAGFRGLAKKIRKETGGGDELLEFALSVFRGEHPVGGRKFSERWDAFVWLTERGFGKAVTQIEIQTSDDDPTFIPAISLSELSDEDLEAMDKAAAIMERLYDKNKPIDV